MNKKHYERISLNKLKKYYENFPVGKIEDSEGPDFIVRSNEKKIGFEIVRIYQDKSYQEILSMAIENSQDYIIREAKIICESLGVKPLEVHVFFGNYSNTVNSNKKEIAIQLAQSVMDNIPSINTWHRIENNFDGTIPDLIHSFTILNLPSMTRHHWSIPRSGFVQEEFIKEMQNVIDSKNIKYEGYLKKCDECWLIIDAPGDTPSSFFDPDDETKNYQYMSKFEKTFFVCSFTKSYIELNTIVP